MRLLVSVVLIVLFILLFGFIVTNIDSRVSSITIWTTVYENVITIYVVVFAFFAGVFLTFVIAFFEGAKLRIDNRRLKKQIHEQETEINYLRTQPRSPAPPEPDELTPAASAGRAAAAEGGPHVPSAPVYDADERRVDRDPDDDMYTGGRAV